MKTIVVLVLSVILIQTDAFNVEKRIKRDVGCENDCCENGCDSCSDTSCCSTQQCCVTRCTHTCSTNRCRENCSRNCNSTSEKIQNQPVVPSQTHNNLEQGSAVDVKLANVINTKNEINNPVSVNPTNINSIDVSFKQEQNVTEEKNCCYVIYPNQCNDSFCETSKKYTCTDICHSTSVPVPYPVPIPVPRLVPVDRPVKIPVPVPVKVPQYVNRVVQVPVPVRQPVPVPQPYPVIVPQKYPVIQSVPVPVPQIKQVPVGYPVPVERPVPVPVPVPQTIVKHMVHPVERRVAVPYTYFVRQPVPITRVVQQPYPVPYPIEVPRYISTPGQTGCTSCCAQPETCSNLNCLNTCSINVRHDCRQCYQCSYGYNPRKCGLLSTCPPTCRKQWMNSRKQTVRLGF